MLTNYIMLHSKVKNTQVTVASWNLLADGMSDGEFLTDGGDSQVTSYPMRMPRLATCLRSLFESGTTIVATQENDHPSTLQKLIGLNYVGKLMIPKNCSEIDSNARKIMDGIAPQGWNTKLDDSQPGGRRLHHTDETREIYSTAPVSDASLLFRDCESLHDLELKRTYPNGVLSSPNDSLVIYYDSRVVTPSSTIIIRPLDQKNQFGGCFFKRLVDGQEFLLINAHLSSGEEAHNAGTRRQESITILGTIPAIFAEYQKPADLPVIITMDSNSSHLYQLPVEYQTRAEVKVVEEKKGKPIFDKESVEAEHSQEHPTIGDIVDTVFSASGYTNLVDIDGNECLKMRHGSGGQPSKFGSFMFDTIDKIWTQGCPTTTKVPKSEVQQMSGFHYYPDRLQPLFQGIRENASLRELLKAQVTEHQWTDTVGLGTRGLLPDECFSILPQRAQLYLYPNMGDLWTCAPSDHPPVVCRVDW